MPRFPFDHIISQIIIEVKVNGWFEHIRLCLFSTCNGGYYITINLYSWTCLIWRKYNITETYIIIRTFCHQHHNGRYVSQNYHQDQLEQWHASSQPFLFFANSDNIRYIPYTYCHISCCYTHSLLIVIIVIVRVRINVMIVIVII